MKKGKIHTQREAMRTWFAERGKTLKAWWEAVRERMKAWWEAVRERMKVWRERQTAEYGEIEETSKRITMESVTANFLDVWGFGNKNIFVTLKHLFWRPGFMMRDYLDGRRGRIMQPVKMLVVLTLVLMFMVKVMPVEVVPRQDVGTQFDALRTNLMNTEEADSEDKARALRFVDVAEKIAVVREKIKQWEDEHPDFGLLLQFSWTILLLWLLFRKTEDKTYNFAEIMTVVCYALCQLQAISIVWLVCTAWWHPDISFRPFIFPYWIAHIVFFIDFLQLFQRRWWSTLWRTAIALLF